MSHDQQGFRFEVVTRSGRTHANDVPFANRPCNDYRSIEDLEEFFRWKLTPNRLDGPETSGLTLSLWQFVLVE